MTALSCDQALTILGQLVQALRSYGGAKVLVAYDLGVMKSSPRESARAKSLRRRTLGTEVTRGGPTCERFSIPS